MYLRFKFIFRDLEEFKLKVDKSTMANSIEVRLPFLDKDLTEFMLSIPSNLKVKGGIKKYLLKKALDGIVPDKILYGKKTGFSVPYNYWLKTSLANYFLEQISTLKASEYLNQNELIKMFYLNKAGKGNFGFLLWKTLIFAVWLNKNS
jgi:asparagine synthase (glutamine-hydrolysing)